MNARLRVILAAAVLVLGAFVSAEVHEQTRAEASGVIWAPMPGPQEAFIACPIEDVLYGGARYGGKTDALIGDFITHASKFGDRAKGVLFRRSYTPELEEVIARTKQILGALGWHYVGGAEKRWTAPNGAVLLLRYLDNDDDAELYRGHQYTWMGFDEIGNWKSSRGIDTLYGCLRSPYGVPCVRRSTCNPGGVGHAWVKARYRLRSDICQPFVPFRWAPLAELPHLTIESVFIPSRLEDNVFAANDPGYEARLAAMSGGSAAIYEANRHGNWDVLAGAYFDMWSRDRNVVRAADVRIEPWYDTWASVDWGYKHLCAVQLHAWDGERIITWRERDFRQKEAEEIADGIAEAANGKRLSAIYLSPDAFARKQDEQTLAIRMGERLTKRNQPLPSPAVTDRVNGWRMMGASLSSGAWVITDDCPGLIAAIPERQRDPDHPEDVLKIDDDGDDRCDCSRYGLMSRPRAPQKPIEVEIAEKLAGVTDPTSYAIRARQLTADQWRQGAAFAKFGGRRRSAR